jgi:hypothetical protein
MRGRRTWRKSAEAANENRYASASTRNRKLRSRRLLGIPTVSASRSDPREFNQVFSTYPEIIRFTIHFHIFDKASEIHVLGSVLFWSAFKYKNVLQTAF